MKRIEDGDARLLRAVRELVAMLRLAAGTICITLHDGKACKIRIEAERAIDKCGDVQAAADVPPTPWQSPVDDAQLSRFVRERMEPLIRERIGDHGHLDIIVRNADPEYLVLCEKWKLAG